MFNLLPFVIPPASFNRYLLDDEFEFPASAPLTSPRTCEPGPGTLTIVDTTPILSIANDILTPTGNTKAVRDPWIYEAAGRPRVNGLALSERITRLTGSGNAPVIGFGTTLTTPTASQICGATFFDTSSGNTIFAIDTSSQPQADVGTTALTVYATICVVLRATGDFVFVNGALIWAGFLDSTATMYPMILGQAASAPFYLTDALHIGQIGSPFDTDFGIATLHQTSGLTNGATFGGNADGIHDIHFTTPGSPAAGDTLGMHVRQSDTSNYLDVYIKRNVGNTAWDAFLDKVVAGSRSPLTSALGVGGPNGVRLITNGSKLTMFTFGGGTGWSCTARGSIVTDAFNSSATGLAVNLSTGTAQQFDDYPRTSSNYNAVVAFGG